MTDCIHFPEQEFSEFNARLRREGKRAPLSGGMELTHRCNMRCVHCYCRREASDHQARSTEMTFGEICRIVDQLAEAGCLYLYLTGGEPLLRPDFLKIYDYVRNKGFLLTVLTNGTMITPSIADHMAKYPPYRLEISLYGATQETYESITQVPGSYEKFRQAVSLLKERGVRIVLKTPFMTLNEHEFAAIKDWADDLGVHFFYATLLHPRIEGMEDPNAPYKYALSLERTLEMDLADADGLAHWRAMLDRLNGSRRPAALYFCGAGLYGFFITVEGNLVMCIESRWPAYDLREGSFQEGWDVFLGGIRSQILPENSQCRDCRLYALCKQCPARSQLEYGEEVVDRSVQWLCQLGHLRADAFLKLGIYHLE